MEYLINVALTFSPYLTFGLVAWFIVSMTMNHLEQFKNKPVYKSNSKYLGGFLAITFVLSATTPSITYKHQPFDSEREAYQIELIKQQQQERTDLVIQDRTRPDAGMTQEEWDAKSSYDKGVE